MTDSSEFFTHANFFMIRTPSGDLGMLDALRNCKSEQELIEHLSTDLFKSALYLASYNLAEKCFGKTSPNRDVVRSVLKYAYRWCTRSTPFGMFAGVATGTFKTSDKLVVKSPDSWKFVPRIDAGVAFWLKENTLENLEDRLIIGDLNIKLNDSVWKSPSGYRYVEATSDKSSQHYQQSTLSATNALDQVYYFIGSTTRRVDELVSILVSELKASRADAYTFVLKLLREQFLQFECDIRVIGINPIQKYISELAELPIATESAKRLSQVASSIERNPLDNRHSKFETLKKSINAIQEIYPEVDPSKAIQVDTFASYAHAELATSRVRTTLEHLSELTPILSRSNRSGLENFVREFEQKFGDRFAPLLMVLDDDFGVHFSDGSSIPTPFISGLAALQPNLSRQNYEHSAVDIMLASRIIEVAKKGGHNLELSESDIAQVSGGSVPSSAGIIGSYTYSEYPDVGFDLQGAFSPVGRLMGRFCVDEDIRSLVQGFTNSLETNNNENEISAEFGHLPAGRVGNVIFRPSFTEYEIPYLGSVSAPREKQIHPRDILVGHVNGKIVLRHSLTGEIIRPRITNVHNFNNRLNLPLYRFMGLMQMQDEPRWGWSWSAIFATSKWLPSVTYKSIRLSKERWFISRKMTAEFSSQQSEFERYLKRSNVPDRVRLVQGDNFLEFDLSYELDREVLWNEVRSLPGSILERSPDLGLTTKGENQTVHRNEIIIPVHGTNMHNESMSSEIEPRENFGVESDWIYVKLFCGLGTQDELLKSVYLNLVRVAETLGLAKCFFIRYRDQGGVHLRIRIRSNSPTSRSTILEFIESKIRAHDQLIFYSEYSSYTPEYHRYGGVEGVDICEKIFSLESKVIATAVDTISSAKDPESSRVKLGLFSWVCLLVASKSGINAKSDLAALIERGYADEFPSIGSKKLNQHFRKWRSKIESLLIDLDSSASDLGVDLVIYIGALKHLFEKLRNVKGINYDRVLLSVFHMSANRIFPESARLHEFVMAHSLGKCLTSFSGRIQHDPSFSIPNYLQTKEFER